MNFFGYSLPLGKFFGISVRVHFTFFFYVYYYLSTSGGDYLFGFAIIIGLYVCILLHEFGHSLATRFCGGDADEIILWPFGGLAFCRPIFHPTAELITTVAGPMVTLVLWGLFSLISHIMQMAGWYESWAYEYILYMAYLNRWLLIFNLIPAFPMDGGRIFLELLWYRLGFEKAARIAIMVSQGIAVIGMIVGFSGYWGGRWIGFMSLMVFFESAQQVMCMATGAVIQPFSLKQCLKQWNRRRIFFGQIRGRVMEESTVAFHACAVCKRTERDVPGLAFRVAADGCEYCVEHLPSKKAPS